MNQGDLGIFITDENNIECFRIYEAMEVAKILNSDINYLFSK